MLFILSHRVRPMCSQKPENLLWKHSTRQIHYTICSPQYQAGPPRENPTLVAFLPFVHTKFNCISGLLCKTAGSSLGSRPLHFSCQELPWPKTLAIYSIFCKHGKMYIDALNMSFRRGSRDTNGISTSVSQRNRRWLNTASYLIIHNDTTIPLLQ